MVSIQEVSVSIAAVGVLIAAVNSIISSKRAEKQRQTEIETRQAQLFMSLYENARNPEFVRQYYELRYHYEWDDYDDYLKKYDPETNIEAYTTIFSVLGFFEGMGVLLEQKLIDLSQVYKLLYPLPNSLWNKIGPIFREHRERRKSPTAMEWFEYLVNELNEYNEQRISAIK